MIHNVKRLVANTVTSMELVYKIVKGIDYKTLNHYILKINQLHDIEGVLYVLSRCLKDILDYRLFGFALKDGDNIDVWIDPMLYNLSLVKNIEADFNSQKTDFNVHYFEKEIVRHSQNSDIADNEDILSYRVLDKKYMARLYILPGKRMFGYHDEIMNILAKTTGITLENTINLKKLEDAATLDPLTGCYNRRALNSYIDHDIAKVQRHGGELSVVMFDIDHFKKINDTYGHKAGDIVLQEVAGMVLSSIRQSDYLARYGGEEFVLVLPDTKLSRAVELAERLRSGLEKLQIEAGEHTIHVTSSFGVTRLKKGVDKERLIQEADEFLYKAKAGGRNNVKHGLINEQVTSFGFFEEGGIALPHLREAAGANESTLLN